MTDPRIAAIDTLLEALTILVQEEDGELQWLSPGNVVRVSTLIETAIDRLRATNDESAPHPGEPMFHAKLTPEVNCSGTKRQVHNCVADHMPEVFARFYHRQPRTGWRRRLFGA